MPSVISVVNAFAAFAFVGSGFSPDRRLAKRGLRAVLVYLTVLTYANPMNEIVFEVTQEADGGFVAECLSEPIFTQGENWESLRKNVREAVSAFFFDRKPAPSAIRLHLVRDEILANG